MLYYISYIYTPMPHRPGYKCYIIYRMYMYTLQGDPHRPIYIKRDLLRCQKRPITVSKETYYSRFSSPHL